MSAEEPKSSSGAVIYTALEAAGGSSFTPIPDFHLYKAAREEELCTYRGLCRVFGMHYGLGEGGDVSAMPRGVQRILEDLKDMWKISDDREVLERQSVAEDAVVRGVFQSRILQRREDFYDGVDDVEIASASHELAEDDGYVAAVKKLRVEQQSPSSQPDVSSLGRSNESVLRKRKATINAIETIKKEVHRAARNLLYSADPIAQDEAQTVLEDKRRQLMTIRSDLEAM